MRIPGLTVTMCYFKRVDNSTGRAVETQELKVAAPAVGPKNM